MELPKVTDLKKIIKFCRENGINSLKHGDFEVTLSPASHFPAKDKPADTTATEGSSAINFAEMTPEQIMFWSSSQLPAQEGEPQ